MNVGMYFMLLFLSCREIVYIMHATLDMFLKVAYAISPNQ